MYINLKNVKNLKNVIDNDKNKIRYNIYSGYLIYDLEYCKILNSIYDNNKQTFDKFGGGKQKLIQFSYIINCFNFSYNCNCSCIN